MPPGLSAGHYAKPLGGVRAFGDQAAATRFGNLKVVPPGHWQGDARVTGTLCLVNSQAGRPGPVRQGTDSDGLGQGRPERV